MMSVDNSTQSSAPEERMAERLRRKAAEGARKVSNASDYSSGGDGFDDEGLFSRLHSTATDAGTIATKGGDGPLEY